MQGPHLEKAKKIQKLLSKRVKICKYRGPLRIIGGIDMSYVKPNLSIVAYVETVYGRDNLVRETWISVPVNTPYIPTYLFLREGPPMLRLLVEKGVNAEIIMVNGHGLTHPRMMGLATYIGVVMGLPTIGVAKKPLFGEAIGEIMPGVIGIKAHGKIVGAIIRSGTGGRLYVSVGHRINLHQSIKVVLDNLGKNPLPVPLYRADQLSKSIAKRVKAGQALDQFFS